MRDHQIVISLKPEQFQQLQELARAAGAKSVGTFLREQLLSTLGVAGEASTHSAVPNWQLIGGQIRRLHRELQLFIAESSNMPEEANEFPFLIKEDSLIMEEDSDDDEQSYSLPETEAIEVPALPGQLTPVSPPAPTPEPISARAPQPIVPPQQPPEPAVDLMEALADRTFAISPRLGALDDPLQDLLEDSLLNPSDEDDDMDDDEDEEEEQSPAQAPEQEQAKEDDEQTQEDGDGDDEDEEDEDRKVRRPRINLLAEPDPDQSHSVVTAYDAEDKSTTPQPPPKRGLAGENEGDNDDESEGFANQPPLSGGPPQENAEHENG